MKKLIYYIILMMIITIILPLVITKGCSTSKSKIKETPPEKQTGINIKVYFHKEDIVKEVYLEEYITGVVAAEMPAEFHPEALKAQAVAARTYACSRVKKLYHLDDNYHKGADVCTDHNHCQEWISKDDAFKNWGNNGNKYWSKIEDSVSETKNLVAMYDGEMINALYHSNSSGKTENVEDVWDCKPVPYLKSVESQGEEESKSYKVSSIKGNKDFEEVLKEKYPDIKLDERDIAGNVKISSYTVGGRVKAMTVGNITMSGNNFRDLFVLRSTNFTIENVDKNNVKVTTLGSGHGVGMSQWGANYLAKNGKSFKEILEHYYKGSYLQDMN